MKYLPLFLIALTVFNVETSKADVCITGVQLSQNELSFYYGEEREHGGQVYLATWTCQDLDRVSTGLEVASIAFSGAAIYAACTGVGIPATVALEGGALALTGINLIVSSLDCEDTDTDALIQKRVEEAVCVALNAQGIGCYPPLQQSLGHPFEI